MCSGQSVACSRVAWYCASIPSYDEISTLAEAVLQRIQWHRRDIVLRSKQVSSQTVAKENTKSASDAAKTIVPSKEPDEPAGAPKTALIAAVTKSAPKTGAASADKKVAAKSAPNNAATKGAAENAASADKNVAAKSASNTAAAKGAAGNAAGADNKEAAKSALNTATAKSAAENAASGEKKVAANSRAENKKMPENKKQPKQKGIASAWTKANPRYRYGQPMLTAAQLESAGPATKALHKYYMKGCVAKQIDVVVQYKRNHF